MNMILGEVTNPYHARTTRHGEVTTTLLPEILLLYELLLDHRRLVLLNTYGGTTPASGQGRMEKLQARL